MAEQIKYVSLENLTQYDGKIKKYLADADAVIQDKLDAEALRAQGAELTNAQAAEAAQQTADQNAADIVELNAKVDEFQSLTDDEINAILSDAPALITFKINEYEYQAEEGMTWYELVNSAYNLDYPAGPMPKQFGANIEDDTVCTAPIGAYIRYNEQLVRPNDVIVANAVYSYPNGD